MKLYQYIYLVLLTMINSLTLYGAEGVESVVKIELESQSRFSNGVKEIILNLDQAGQEEVSLQSMVELDRNWFIASAHLFLNQDEENRELRFIDEERIKEFFNYYYSRQVKRVIYHPQFLPKQQDYLDYSIKRKEAFEKVLWAGNQTKKNEFISGKDKKEAVKKYLFEQYTFNRNFPLQELFIKKIRAYQHNLVLIELEDEEFLSASQYERRSNANSRSYAKIPGSSYSLSSGDNLMSVGYGHLFEKWRNGKVVKEGSNTLSWRNLVYRPLSVKRFRSKEEGSFLKDLMLKKDLLVFQYNITNTISPTLPSYMRESSSAGNNSVIYHTDSGGALFHKNSDGSYYLVGIHSFVSNPHNFSAQIILPDYLKSKTINLKYLPKDWRDSLKESTSFDEITKIYKGTYLYRKIPKEFLELNEDKRTYRFKNAEEVERSFSFYKTMIVTDLRSKSNQEFLKKHLPQYLLPAAK